MGEDSIYHVLKAHLKEERQNLFEFNSSLMKTACEKYGISCREFNTNSFRLSKPGCETVDFYPTTQKYYQPEQKIRGTAEDVEEFLRLSFEHTREEQEKIQLILDGVEGEESYDMDEYYRDQEYLAYINSLSEE